MRVESGRAVDLGQTYILKILFAYQFLINMMKANNVGNKVHLQCPFFAV